MTGPRLVLGVLVALAACADIEVRMTGPARPARPAGCAVTYFADVRVEGMVDIASANVSCAKSRDRCLEQLRDQACAVGADSIFVTSERSESIYIHMTARFAARAP